MRYYALKKGVEKLLKYIKIYISKKIVKELNIGSINSIIKVLKNYKNKNNILEFKIFKNNLFYNKDKILKLDYSYKKEKEILAIRKEDKEIGKYWDIIVMEEYREEKYGNNEKIKRKISRK